MRKAKLWIALYASLTMPAFAAEPVRIAGILELSGGGASVGIAYKNGLELAAAEINAKGGVLGHKYEVTFSDTQTNPGIARAQMQKALDQEPFVIVGPTFSGSAKASMPLAQSAETPQFTGGGASELTELGNPYIFRTLGSQRTSIPKVVNYLADEIHAKRVGLVWANTDLGKGGRDVFLKSAKAKGIEVVLDLSTEQGQVDFASDVLKLKNANIDSVFLAIHEEEVARFLKERQRSGLVTPVFGEQTVLNPKVLELAGNAGVGAKGYIPLTGDAPVQAMREMSTKFRAKFGYIPDHNGIQGYIAGYAIKAVIEKVGKLDRKLFSETLHGSTITTAQEPGILLTTAWDRNGDIDRDGFLAEVEEGNRLKIIKTLPRSGN